MTEAKKPSRTSVAKPTTGTKSKASPAKAAPPKKAATTGKAATKTPTAAKVAPKRAAKPRAATTAKPSAVAPEQRRNYVEVAAYYIAARRGFAPGDPLQDWIQAEAEVDRLLGEGLLGGLEG